MHVVNFYASDDDLVSAVGAYVAEGLVVNGYVEEDVLLIIATPTHRKALDAWLVDHRFDVEDMIDRGLYIALDAAGTLASFMVDGMPDGPMFRAVIEPFLRDALRAGRTTYTRSARWLGCSGTRATLARRLPWRSCGTDSPLGIRSSCTAPTRRRRSSAAPISTPWRACEPITRE